MQLWLATRHTSETYVSEQGWREARLDVCPLHPEGRCGFRRHGTYRRVGGYQIARYYCRLGRTTVSLMPQFLACRLPGTLAEIETVVRAVEAGTSIEAAASELRPDIQLPGAVRWVRSRLLWTRAALPLACGLIEGLAGCVPELRHVQQALALADGEVLLHLRRTLNDHLRSIPSPLGLCPRSLHPAQGECNNRRAWRARAGPP